MSIVLWGTSAILAAIIAFRNERGWLVGLVLGLIGGPLGPVLVLVLGSETAESKRARLRQRLEKFHTDGELPTPPVPSAQVRDPPGEDVGDRAGGAADHRDVH
jgi:hypothetical protein